METRKKMSAGLLIYRRRGAAIEVLLAHPGGPFWAKKDEGAWTIPKGMIEEGEEPLAAAIRETKQELGIGPVGDFEPLGTVTLKSGKTIFAWAHEGDYDTEHITSNFFEVEWPPRSGVFRQFPEVDRAGYFSLEEAKRKIHAGQAPLLERLSQS